MAYCIQCRRHFANRSNLNRHLKLFHNGNLSTPKASKEEYIDVSEDDDDVSSNGSQAMDDDDDDSSETSETEDNTDDEDVDEHEIWLTMKEESGQLDMNIVDFYKAKVLFCRELKRNRIHQAIMETLNRARNEEDMSFSEALSYAVDKRKFLIYQTVEE